MISATYKILDFHVPLKSDYYFLKESDLLFTDFEGVQN